MLALVPTGDRNPAGHTKDTILAALRGLSGSRRFSFRYRLLEPSGAVVEEDLDNVLGGSVSQNWLADIKRTATFTMLERGGIDFLSDRIQPVVRLHLPPYGPADWVEYPQGVFLLTTPSRSASVAGVVTREVQGYDQLQVYSDDLLATRYTVATGAVVTTAVTTLLASVLVAPKVRVTPHAGTLTAAKEWEPGTSKLRVINDLLGMINYESLSFDEDGVAVVQPYQSPAARAEEYVYANDHQGLVMPDAGQELDLFAVANHWVLVVSEPDQPPLVAAYTNSNPASPTSTVRRQRTITDYRTEQEATDLTTLQARVARLAVEASQVYEAVTFKTGLMPIHSGNDVYRVTLSSLALNAAYAEQSWTMPLKAGAEMAHVARRVITV
jgi:hypothetical protein